MATAEAEIQGPALPNGYHLDLPGRGRTFVREINGPPGAPTVFLLHGLSATADLNWFPTFAPLGARYHVLAIDHRGHGRGIRSRRRFRLADCADDVAAVAEQRDIKNMIAVGYSMGGPISQLLWHRHQDLVSGLVLCATSRDFRGSPRERVLFNLLPPVSLAARMTPGVVRREAVRRMLSDRLGETPMARWATQELRRNNPATLAEAAQALGRFTSREWIGEVDVPSAVVVTTKDRAVPPHRQRKLAASIPGAAVFEVDGDHGACVMDASRFVPVLLRAVRSVAEGQRAAAT
jgi:pimeloyl-ACP methyl ester carboxylesterase